MYSAIAVALAVLGIAYLIRNFVDETIEFKNAFFVIIGIFLLIYVGAAIFVTGRVSAWMEEKKASSGQGFDWNINIFEQPVTETDLSTPP